MITLRWVAIVLAVETLIALGIVPRSVTSMVLAGVFLVLFVFICWTFGAFTRGEAVTDGDG